MRLGCPGPQQGACSPQRGFSQDVLPGDLGAIGTCHVVPAHRPWAQRALRSTAGACRPGAPVRPDPGGEGKRTQSAQGSVGRGLGDSLSVFSQAVCKCKCASLSVCQVEGKRHNGKAL